MISVGRINELQNLVVEEQMTNTKSEIIRSSLTNEEKIIVGNLEKQIGTYAADINELLKTYKDYLKKNQEADFNK